MIVCVGFEWFMENFLQIKLSRKFKKYNEVRIRYFFCLYFKSCNFMWPNRSRRIICINLNVTQIMEFLVPTYSLYTSIALNRINSWILLFLNLDNFYLAWLLFNFHLTWLNYLSILFFFILIIFLMSLDGFYLTNKISLIK